MHSPSVHSAPVGVFAPGHLGELTRFLPVELVDDVLTHTPHDAAPGPGAAVADRGVLRARPGPHLAQIDY